MAISEKLKYVLDFDTKSAVKDVEKFGKTADKELGKASDRLDKIAGSMVKVGAGALAFAGVAGAALFKMASGAADTEANFSALEQVVGETVAQPIDKWARNAADEIGLARREALEGATGFAQLGKKIGLTGNDLSDFSTSLVDLSADFAAFKNVTPEKALQDVRAAFAGSTEVMRPYGIFLDDAALKQALFRETGERVTGTLTAQQKIIAINSEMYRQGADMIGQFARESGEMSGQTAIAKARLKNLSDEIGAGVLPHVVSLLTIVTDLTGWLGKLGQAGGGTVGQLAALAVAIAAVGGGMLIAAGKIIQFRKSLGESATAMKTLVTTSPRLATGMGVASVAMAAFAAHSYTASKNAAEFQGAVDEIARKSAPDMIEHLNGMLLVLTKFSDRSPEEIFSKIAKEQLGAAQTALEYAKANGESQEIIDGLTAAIETEVEARKNAANAAEAEQAALEDNTEATEDNTAAAEEAKKAAEEQQAALKDLSNELRENINALEEQNAAQRSAVDSSYALIKAQFDLEDAVAETSEAMTEGTEFTREHAEASLKLRDAAQKVADAKVREATDQAKARGATLSATEAINIQNRSLINTAATLNGPQRAALLDHISRINNIPASKMTDIHAAMDRGDIDTAERLINNASRTRTTAVRADTDQASLNATENRLNNLARTRTARINAAGGGTATLQYRARGTQFDSPGTRVVGEEGPEIVELPHGAKVTPAGKSKERLGSGSSGSVVNNTIIQNFPAGVRPSDVVDAQRKHERRNGPQ